MIQGLDLWDATEEPDAEARARRSVVVERMLEQAGWKAMGVLGVRRGDSRGHPDQRDVRRVVWCAPHGHAVAMPWVDFGRDELVVMSLLQNGAVVRTDRWTSPNHTPVDLDDYDPARPAPALSLSLIMATAGAGVSRDYRTFALHHPENGFSWQFIASPDPREVLLRHDAEVHAHLGVAGAPVPLTLPLAAALVERAERNTSEGDFRATGAVALAMVVGILLFLPALVWGDRAWAATWEAALPWNHLGPKLWGWHAGGFWRIGTALASFAVGAGTVRRFGWIGLLPWLACLGWFAPWQPRSLTLVPGVGFGVAAGWCWARFFLRPVSRVCWHVVDALLGPRGTWDTVAEMRARPLAPPRILAIPPDAMPAAAWVDPALLAADFRPLGGRTLVVEGHPDATAMLPLWASADGRTVAEIYDEPGVSVGLTLRSLSANGTLLETRSLPDPGPPLRRLKQKTVDPDLDLPIVTRALLDRARWWPSRAALRVADRPQNGLRVVHAQGIDGALAEHVRRVGQAPLAESPVDLALGLTLGQRSEQAQPAPRRTFEHLVMASMLCSVSLLYLGALWLPVHESVPIPWYRSDETRFLTFVHFVNMVAHGNWTDGTTLGNLRRRLPWFFWLALPHFALFGCMGLFSGFRPPSRVVALYAVSTVLLTVWLKHRELRRT